VFAHSGAHSIQGIDLSEEAIEYCIESYRTPNTSYAVGDAQSLTKLKDGEFDVVASFETIEHVPDVEAYLDEMVRILRPGGHFLVSTPDRRISSVFYRLLAHPHDKFHVREYTGQEFVRLVSTRFQIEACYGQAFVPRWLVFWPVQVFIKSFCRILGSPKARAFKDNLYSNGGDVELKPSELASGIPKYWVIACTRPDR